MPDDALTVQQKLNSRTLWVTVTLLIGGLAIGVVSAATWLPDAGKAMFDLALFSAGIMVGKSGVTK